MFITKGFWIENETILEKASFGEVYPQYFCYLLSTPKSSIKMKLS